MKRFLSVILLLSAAVSLCGCTPQSATAAEYSSLLVAAAGFEQNNEEITVILEALAINSEDFEAENQTVLYRGAGKTVREAIHNAEAAAAQPLHLGHCAVLILSDNISESAFAEICDYCRGQSELTLSVAFIFTESAEKLLSCKTSSSIAMGYEIANMLTEQYSRSGIAFKNRFYELEAARATEAAVISLPYFKVEADTCVAEGSMLLKNDKAALYLSPEQTAAFALATGALSRGTVFIKNTEFNIKNTKTRLEFKARDSLSAELSLKIASDNTADFKIIEANITELYELSKKKGIDIFSFSNVLSEKHPDLWQKFKSEFITAYRNSEMAVTVK